MPQWKNKEEYEKWKAEKAIQKTTPQQSQPDKSAQNIQQSNKKKAVATPFSFMNIDIDKLPLSVKLFLISIAIVITIIVISGGKSKEISPAVAKWYSGGTLHNKTLNEWHTANYKNRLATSADFITSATPENKHSLLFKNDMEVLKYRASSLEKCITDSSKGLEEMYVIKTAESAGACIILLKY